MRMFSDTSVQIVSLEESINRRENLIRNWFKKYNITNYTFHLFKRIHEYSEYKFEGPFIHQIDEFSKGTSSSHLSALKKWYETTTEPYTLVFEDDISFETVQYWNFTWKEFVDTLPKNWNCIQLVVKKTEFYDKNFKFHLREDDEWSAAAYLIKREYVKFLLESYYPEKNIFTYDIKGTNIIPVVEQLLFLNIPYHESIYSFPLFVEDVYNLETTNLNSNTNTQYSFDSHENVLYWWKEKGKTMTIGEILNLENFDWGIKSQEFIDFVSHEIFVDKVYEKFYDVKEGDIVVDVGASAGPFTYSILNKKPAHVYCIEPSQNFFEILERNMQGKPVTCINKAISSKKNSENTSGHRQYRDKEIIVFWSDAEEKVETISFDSFVKENQINHIDMLKMDCEGGEYDILNEENLDFILSSVNNIAVELHFISENDEFHYKFKNFKENILPKIPHFKIYSIPPYAGMVANDLTDKINVPNYIEKNHSQLMLYVKREPFGKKRKIIDCFSFCGEKNLLDIRYRLLHEKVDKFVILDYSQQPKKTADECIAELNLSRQKFIIIKTMEEKKNKFDSFANILHLFEENDVFFFSDCSEVIKPECVEYFADMALKNSSELIKVPITKITNEQYSIDDTVFIATKNHFNIVTPSQLRYEIHNPFPIVYVTQDGKRLENCGWKFN
jgi:FkbM family methyltransferase